MGGGGASGGGPLWPVLQSEGPDGAAMRAALAPKGKEIRVVGRAGAAPPSGRAEVGDRGGPAGVDEGGAGVEVQRRRSDAPVWWQGARGGIGGSGRERG